MVWHVRGASLRSTSVTSGGASGSGASGSGASGIDDNSFARCYAHAPLAEKRNLAAKARDVARTLGVDDAGLSMAAHMPYYGGGQLRGLTLRNVSGGRRGGIAHCLIVCGEGVLSGIPASSLLALASSAGVPTAQRTGAPAVPGVAPGAGEGVGTGVVSGVKPALDAADERTSTDAAKPKPEPQMSVSTHVAVSASALLPPTVAAEEVPEEKADSVGGSGRGTMVEDKTAAASAAAAAPAIQPVGTAGATVQQPQRIKEEPALSRSVSPAVLERAAPLSGHTTPTRTATPPPTTATSAQPSHRTASAGSTPLKPIGVRQTAQVDAARGGAPAVGAGSAVVTLPIKVAAPGGSASASGGISSGTSSVAATSSSSHAHPLMGGGGANGGGMPSVPQIGSVNPLSPGPRRAGITPTHFFLAKPLYIAQCDLSNRGGGGAAVLLADGAHATIFACRIASGSGSGVLLQGGSFMSMLSSTLLECGADGVHVQSGCAVLQDSSITGCAGVGIRLSSAPPALPDAYVETIQSTDAADAAAATDEEEEQEEVGKGGVHNVSASSEESENDADARITRDVPVQLPVVALLSNGARVFDAVTYATAAALGNVPRERMKTWRGRVNVTTAAPLLRAWPAAVSTLNCTLTGNAGGSIDAPDAAWRLRMVAA
ncbi:MAG: right-handed parallel beta-helix repeat-containing protein, partial [Methanobacteriota archaeon]